MTEISPAIAARTALTEDLLAMAYQVEEQLATSITALKDRNPGAARAAMRDHLQRVIDGLLHATETEAVEQARANVAVKRRRYSGRPI